MLSTWSSPAPHLNLSLPKEQWEPCSHPEMPARRDALPGKAPASPRVLEWSVNGLKAGIQSFPNHHELTFGGSQEGSRQSCCTSRARTWHQVPCPSRSQFGDERGQGVGTTLGLSTPSLAAVSSHHVALGPPPWLSGPQPRVTSLLGACVTSQPAGDKGDSGTGQTGAFPSGRWGGGCKQEREVEDSPQKPPGWEKIWSWGANTGSSSCSLPLHCLASPSLRTDRQTPIPPQSSREGKETIQIQLKRKQNPNIPKKIKNKTQPKSSTTRRVHLANIQ